MLQAVANAFKLPDLRRKIIFTLAILVLYRLASHVRCRRQRRSLRALQQNQLLGLLDMFSGGAMSNFSVMAMGVYPYITAQIVLQLLQPIVPALEQLSKEGEAGRQKMSMYTHLLTIPLAALQGLAQASMLASSGAVISNFGFTAANWLPTLSTLFTLTAGTMFAIWLGELIDERGIGNGVSIIIFGGIVSGIPQRLGQLWVTNPWSILAFLIITAITVVGIVMVHEGQRRIPVQYAKRVRGNRVYGGQSTHIPLQVNSAGMIPLIFAVSIIMFPGVVASYFVGSSVGWVASVATWISTVFSSEGVIYWILYLCWWWALTTFTPTSCSSSKICRRRCSARAGSSPGIRPGQRTAEYLHDVLRRITSWGRCSWASCHPAVPHQHVGGTSDMLVTSTGLLIVVGVVLDTMKQLEAQLLMRHYEGFIRKMR
jgi:preprotein translocase subunit SecY